jgi:N,N-dimethylformamidase
MLNIVGYCSKLSVVPGEAVTFYVSSYKSESYAADIVRLIHGDTNPDGPGYKEEEIPNTLSDTYPGRPQEIHSGSYAIIPHDDRFNVGSFTLQAMIFPTTPAKGLQGLMGKWSAEDSSGYALVIEEDGSLGLWIGGEQGTIKVSTGKPFLKRVWYEVSASYNAETGKIRLIQLPVPTHTNGGNGMGVVFPVDESTADVTFQKRVGQPKVNIAPFIMAALTKEVSSGRSIFGGHFKEATSPIALPLQSNCYNGKIDRPRLSRTPLERGAIDTLVRGFRASEPTIRNQVVAAWDFQGNLGRNAATTQIIDTSTNGLNGFIINMPARGMTGYNWTGDEISYRHARDEYGAIHFHDDDIDDARWSPDFSFEIPNGLPSGIYAARLRVGGVSSSDTEDYIPFFVRPPHGETTAEVALIMPICSYLAYSNDNLATDSVIAQLLRGAVPLIQVADLTVNEHREFGLSLYSVHSDGSGVFFSSRLRPIMNIRPKYRHWLTPSLWQFNADLHLTDWLAQKGIKVDIYSDADLEREGVGLLNRYKVVLTGTHPEYSTEKHIDAFSAYQHSGGRFMYLGGDGFYWCTSFHPDNEDIVEVRKGEAGNRAYTTDPGEYSQAFDGGFGGMWRARGRSPSKVCGLTFAAYGFDVSSYYRRMPESNLEQCSWIFDGVGEDEIIGDFGLVGGGAAGLEIDRYAEDVGTPHQTYVLARSEGHSDLMQQVNEEILHYARGYWGGGDENPMVRADMIYYKTANEGGTWAPGSITWCGSLSHNDYDNNVSRITENVLRGFLKEGPLP